MNLTSAVSWNGLNAASSLRKMKMDTVPFWDGALAVMVRTVGCALTACIQLGCACFRRFWREPIVVVISAVSVSISRR